MIPSPYLDRSYRYALRVMMVGWLIGLLVFGLSWLNARSALNSARDAAQAIWAKPQGVIPATLSDRIRMALLALIESKYKLPERKDGGAAKQVPENMTLLTSSRQPPQAKLVRDFVKVARPTQIYWLGTLGDSKQAQSDSPPILVVSDDSWYFLVKTDTGKHKSAQLGNDWWFVDPATGLAASKDLSDIETDLEWVNLSAAIAFILSLPWLWFFLRIQLDSGSSGR
jgi:hypothetical protein